MVQGLSIEYCTNTIELAHLAPLVYLTPIPTVMMMHITYPQCKYSMIILNTQYIPAYPIPPVQIFHVAHLPEFWTGLGKKREREIFSGEAYKTEKELSAYKSMTKIIFVEETR